MMASRWVYGSADGRSHLLADPVAGAVVPTRVTMCGRSVSTAVAVFSVPPNLDVCDGCAQSSMFSTSTGTPRFGTQPAPP